MMTYWVLPISGRSTSLGIVQRLPLLKQKTEAWQQKIKQFQANIEDKMKAASADWSNKVSNKDNLLSLEDESEEFQEEFEKVIDNKKLFHAEKYFHSDGNYTGMEVALRRGDNSSLLKVKVKKRARDLEGYLLSTTNDNPLIDTSQYEIE